MSTISERELVRQTTTMVRDRLPSSWKTEEILEPLSDRRHDGEIMIEAPGGRTARLIIEAKQVIERRDVPRMSDQVRRMVTNPDDVPVVSARYLSASVREALANNGLSYVDATGNMRIASDTLPLFISDRGADHDPWRKGRPLGTLKGEPAARVARTLLDYQRSWRVRELIEASGASSGATYRVLDYLQREDLIVKNDDRYYVTDWERLLRAWSADAAYKDTTRVLACIEPRGLDAFLSRLSQKWAFPIAVTGSVAAKEWVTYAPAKAAFVYVSSIHEAVEQFRLRSNKAAPNVILLEPATVGDVPFRNVIQSMAGYPIAAPSQVAADLLNGPGREPAEGEELIQWMKTDEEQWRLMQ